LLPSANWLRRQTLAEYYESRLRNLAFLHWPKTLHSVRHARHLFPIWVEPSIRDQVIQGLQGRGISVMVNYRAIHLLTYFRETLGYRFGDFPIAERIGDSTISLPFYPAMPLEHADYVAQALADLACPRRLSA
jgi:UDP-4-amino-4-deoxy-L-arabinose-oxoglutarate aminotransferase